MSLRTQLMLGITHGKQNFFIQYSLPINFLGRCSSVCAYYVDRPNFKVFTNTTVTRIMWDRPSASSNGPSAPLKARAVEFRTSDGETNEINVAKEVILSAGAIGSPKVLELSGIGNST